MTKKNAGKNQKNKKYIKKNDEKSVESFDEKVFNVLLNSEHDSTGSVASKLEESNKKLQLIIDAMPAIIGYINTEYKFQFANKFLKNFLNVNPSDIIGKHIKDVAGEKAFEAVKSKYDKAFAGERQEFETLIPIPNGSVKPIHATYVPHKVKGKIEGTFILIQDITKRKRDEKELKDAKNALEKVNIELGEALNIGINQFNLFADNLPGNLFIKDDKLEYVFLNRTFLKVFKLNKKNVKGLTAHDLYPENIANKLHEVDLEVQKEKQIIEKEIKTNEGQINEKWERVIKFPIKMPDGKIFVGGIALDITQEKQRSEAIINSELRYRSLFESARDAIIIIDFDKIIDVNQSTLKKFGYKDKSEIINKSVVDISPKFQPDGNPSRDSAIKVIKKALTGESQLFNWKHKRKDGTEFYTEVSLNKFSFNKNNYILASVRDISKRIAIEQELIKAKEHAETSEKYLENIINNIGDPVFVNDEQNNFLLVNDAFCSFLGLTRENIIGKTLAEDISPQEMEGFLRVNKEVFETGKESIIEELVTLKSGETKTIYTKKTRYIDSNGKKHLIGVVRDITERVNIENELKKAQTIARLGNWYLDILTNEIVWSDELYEMYGLDPLRPVPPYEEHVKYFTPESWELLSTSIENTIKIGESYSIELQANEAIENLNWKWMAAQGEAVFDSENRVIAVRGTAQDITDRKLAEENIKETLMQLNLAVNTAKIGVWTHDIATSELVWNNELFEIYGITSSEFDYSQDSFKKLVHPEDIDLLMNQQEKLIQNKSVTGLNFRIIRPNNEVRYIFGSATPIFDEEGNLIKIIGINLDVTEDRKAEKELKESKAKFEILSNVTFEGILIHDKGVPVDMNTSCHDMFGYTRDEVFDKDLIELIVRKDYRKVVAKNVLNDYELPYEIMAIKKDGAEMPIELEGKTYYSEDNKKLRVTAIRDITERKIAEEKIKEGEANVTSILNSLPASICVINKTGKILQVNDVWKQFGATGSPEKKPKAYTEYNYFDVCKVDWENEHSKAILKGLKGLLKGGTGVFDYEYPCHTSDKEQWFLLRANLMKTKDKQIVISHFDVTERKLAEQSIIESEAKYRTLFEQSLMGIGMAIGQKIVMANKGMLEIFEYESEEEMLKKPLLDLIAPDYRDYIIKRIKEGQTNMGKNLPAEYQYDILCGNGKTKTVRGFTSYINVGGQVFSQTIVTDVTERVKAQNELVIALAEITELKQKVEAENIYLKEELKLEGSFEEIIGASKTLKKVLKQVEQVSKSNTTVLILGETGTGKELIAKAIHMTSDRKNKPLVKVNCSALPSELIESELFGHEKGAFTGAINKKIGRFELANQGTIFLDEIGDLPIDLQTRLLRVLQESEFERLGGEKTIKVDVRVITATNRNLEELVVEGKFRQDLYYRLNVFPVTSPPLRDRKEDIPSLVNHFINKYGNKVKSNIKSVHKPSIDRLMDYDWPGNIRELEHVIERAIVLNQGEQLRIGNWFVNTNSELKNTLVTMEETERDHIIKVLEKTNGKIRGVNGAAEILGLKPTTLESRMKKLNISRKN